MAAVQAGTRLCVRVCASANQSSCLCLLISNSHVFKHIFFVVCDQFLLSWCCTLLINQNEDAVNQHYVSFDTKTSLYFLRLVLLFCPVSSQRAGSGRLTKKEKKERKKIEEKNETVIKSPDKRMTVLCRS